VKTAGFTILEGFHEASGPGDIDGFDFTFSGTDLKEDVDLHRHPAKNWKAIGSNIDPLYFWQRNLKLKNVKHWNFHNTLLREEQNRKMAIGQKQRWKAYCYVTVSAYPRNMAEVEHITWKHSWRKITIITMTKPEANHNHTTRQQCSDCSPVQSSPVQWVVAFLNTIINSR